MIIRRALPQDALPIHEAHMRSIQEICSREHSYDEIKAWGHRPYREDQRLNSIKNDFVWVVESAGKVEGYAHLRNLDGKGHIAGLYFTPEVVGHGLGRKMMELIFQEAKHAGLKEITLESTLTAHAFYQRFGFKDSGPLIYAEINGQKIRCFPMRCVL